MLNGASQITSRSAGRIQYFFAQLRVNHFGNKRGNGTRGIKFTALSRTLQSFQDAFVQFSKSVTVFCHVKIHLVQLVQHLTNVDAAFHVVVISFKYFTYNQRTTVARTHVNVT
ncbi:hypothetical protein D3C72_1978000 [compost metagenome]